LSAVLFLHSISFVFWRLPSSLPSSFVLPSRSISPSFCLSHALFVQRSVHPTPRSRAQSLPPSITLTFCRPFFLPSPRVLHRSSASLLAIDRPRPWCRAGAVAPGVVDAREVALSPPLSTHRLREFCCRPFVPLSLRSVHPSYSPFIRQRFSRSVHLFSGHGPLDAFILRSLVQFLLCSVHLSLVAVFLPIKIHSSVVRLHYTERARGTKSSPRAEERRAAFYGFVNM